MFSSSDASTDPLVARFKHLEETVDKLHRENRSLKNKLQSYNTLSTFYHEARQQNKNLNRQLAEKDSIIQKLRARLESSPAAAEFQVDPSKSLVESLVEQLNRAKSQLTETEIVSQEKVESLNQEIQRLNEQLEAKEQPLASQTQHEKDMEILRLQKSLAEKERVQATSEVLCRSLSDETHQLQRKLAATAEMCQQLVKCIEETHRKDNLNSGERISQKQNKDNDQETDLTKLQGENRLLKQKVVHVEDLNAKWQKYDASREEYVKGLLQQLKEMKAQTEHQKSSHSRPDLLQKEICRLNRLLEDKMNEHTKLQQEAAEVAIARISDREKIQMLEQQLLVYKDDFTSERADRERAQSRIQELLEKISTFQKQKLNDRDSAAQFQIQLGNRNQMHIRKEVTDRCLNTEPAGNRRQTSPVRQLEGQRCSSSERRGQDDLQCPRCLRVFQDRLGENFLEHISECCQ